MIKPIALLFAASLLTSAAFAQRPRRQTRFRALGASLNEPTPDRSPTLGRLSCSELSDRPSQFMLPSEFGHFCGHFWGIYSIVN